MTWKVEIKKIRYPGSAECEGCDQLSPDATRERCRQHAGRNPGHIVHFVVEDATTYARVTREDE